MNSIDYTTQPFEITNDMLATSWQRLANFIIDLIVRTGLVFIVGIIAGLLYTAGYDDFLIWMQNIETWEDMLFTSFLLLLYYLFIESFTQRTLGKYITGTKVVLEDGNKPGARVIFVRTLCRFIPFEAFSFLGDKTRGWHDSLSGTYVVDVKKYNAAVALQNSFDEIGKSDI